MRRLVPCVALFSMAIAVAGCASPRSNFYTLSPAAKPAAGASATSVAVGPVTVPAAVDRPQMVVRISPNEVAVDEFHRWASALPEDIARVVAGNLSSMLGTPRVSVYPALTASGARHRVVIDVMAFESTPGESAALDAVWVVRSARDGTPHTGRTAVREAVQGDGFPALVAAHSRALAKLSADIAGAIQEAESGGKPSSEQPAK